MVGPSSLEGCDMLTLRIHILPELLMVRFAGLGVTIADRPHRGFDHGRADEKLRNSSQA